MFRRAMAVGDLGSKTLCCRRQARIAGREVLLDLAALPRPNARDELVQKMPAGCARRAKLDGRDVFDAGDPFAERELTEEQKAAPDREQDEVGAKEPLRDLWTPCTPDRPRHL
jgi:hypothetical protein